jgi:hypothetical protein
MYINPHSRSSEALGAKLPSELNVFSVAIARVGQLLTPTSVAAVTRRTIRPLIFLMLRSSFRCRSARFSLAFERQERSEQWSSGETQGHADRHRRSGRGDDDPEAVHDREQRDPYQ